MSVEDALQAYTEAAAPGCQTAPECQGLVTNKLAAAEDLKTAMREDDPQVYAIPIGYVIRAGQQADHYGRDNLGAKGNSLAVSLPLQQVVAWFREHPEY